MAFQFFNGKPIIAAGNGAMDYWVGESPLMILSDSESGGTIIVAQTIDGKTRILKVSNFNITAVGKVLGLQTRRRVVIF